MRRFHVSAWATTRFGLAVVGAFIFLLALLLYISFGELADSRAQAKALARNVVSELAPEYDWQVRNSRLLLPQRTGYEVALAPLTILFWL